MDTRYSLGIDIGTTSVKVCVINNHLDIIDENSESTEADVTRSSYSNEQDVVKIIDTLQKCMSHFDVNLLNKVTAIGISGQVHGIVFWNSKNVPWTVRSMLKNRIYEITGHVSHLYTWQDGRCDLKFLSELPKPDSHLKAYTGYGNNTLFWLHRKEPHTIASYDTAGTVADFVVCVLCDMRRPIMSTQNAASWGYFNCKTCEWNTDILEEAGFPVGYLPADIRQPEDIAGHLVADWYGVPAGVPVTVALADLQCSVKAVLENERDAFMNISTSGQLAFVHRDFKPEQNQDFPVEYVIPYFNGQYLIVAALLNGGNSLATFIRSTKSWFEDFGFSLPLEYFWERVVKLAESIEIDEVSIKVDPLFLGERFASEDRASVSNITPENFKLGQIYRAICRGIIRNFYKLIPQEILLDAKINRIIGSGNALIRNKCLQEEIRALYKLPLELKTGKDSAVGAAICALSTLELRQ